jgi:hypothetical protein
MWSNQAHREATGVGWYERADYRWLLLADPPICRGGRPEAVLNNCDRLRRGEVCWCRFETQEAVEDVAMVGEPGALDDWLTAGDLEERDVEDLRDAILRIVKRRRAGSETLSEDAAGAAERLDALAVRLSRVVDRGSGLSDRHADDVD